ncbi:MAG: hypothetical protein GWN93_26900 [Deltaproteobacteria bacterium]|nr:hypothetical protein [Deltaproteobacteria bacterium]
MKKLFLIACIGISFMACGDVEAPRWESLPQEIYVEDGVIEKTNQDLSDLVQQGIDEMSKHFGSTFEVTDNQDAKIIAFCNNELLEDENIRAYAYVNWNQKSGLIYSGTIEVDCDADMPDSYYVYMIAHEMFHSLGFIDHYENPDCLNSITFTIKKTIEDQICDDMVDDFYDRYPEIEQEFYPVMK